MNLAHRLTLTRLFPTLLEIYWFFLMAYCFAVHLSFEFESSKQELMFFSFCFEVEIL